MFSFTFPLKISLTFNLIGHPPFQQVGGMTVRSQGLFKAFDYRLLRSPVINKAFGYSFAPFLESMRNKMYSLRGKG